ncbi:MAG: alpha/beta fold hydrolase [Phycisphaerales bacterium]|nr:alpha/beta fold hydrolase [Phycisphaerales bacterium]MCB9857277.1 alpha/beta fold hydrolase [Phycisphaerales bacterium]MCB9863009.1 alpha/beta fold hydrolase [Phycisphaerales bacterium]
MRKAAVRGIEMAYDDVGAGPIVLCVHGFPLSHRLWLPTAERLSKSFRFLMPDLRGFGDSTATADASMSDYADDLAAFLDALRIDGPVDVMGLSMGGYIVFEFVRRHAAKAKALVLADTQAGSDTPEKAKFRLDAADKVLAEGLRFVVDSMTPNLFAPDASSMLVNEWRDIMLATDPRGAAAAMRAMASRADSTTTFAAIHQPTMVVVGEHDAITPPDVARVMADGIAGATLEVIPAIGHMSPVEAPDAYASIVGEFLEKLN